MAHIKISVGTHVLTGRVGQESDMTGRQKRFRDPVTGDVLGVGPNEYYKQQRRDYTKAPMSSNELRQKERWRAVCKEADVICNDRNHPRYRELYEGWRAQLHDAPDPVTGKKACVYLRNYICRVLMGEETRMACEATTKNLVRDGSV